MATAPPSEQALARSKIVIFQALKTDNITPVIKIVKAGFHVDTPMEQGMTILMHVAGSGDASMLNDIMKLGPNLDVKDNIGRTALHFAARAGNLETFKILVELDEIDIDAVTNAGMTPLMCAVESGAIQVVAESLNNNLNPFLKDALDRTALDYAMYYRDALGDDMRGLI